MACGSSQQAVRSECHSRAADGASIGLACKASLRNTACETIAPQAGAAGLRCLRTHIVKAGRSHCRVTPGEASAAAEAGDPKRLRIYQEPLQRPLAEAHRQGWTPRSERSRHQKRRPAPIRSHQAATPPAAVPPSGTRVCSGPPPLTGLHSRGFAVWSRVFWRL